MLHLWPAWEELIQREASVRFWGRHLCWKEGCCLESRTSQSSSVRAGARTRCLRCTWGLQAGAARCTVMVLKLGKCWSFPCGVSFNSYRLQITKDWNPQSSNHLPRFTQLGSAAEIWPPGCLKSYLFPFRCFSSCMFVLSDGSWNARYSSLRA